MESSEVGRRNTHGNSNLFVPGERRPLSRRRSSLDESSSTEAAHVRGTFSSLLFARFFLEFFFPEPSERKNKRENTLSSDKGIVSKTDLRCTQCAATHPLCVHCCNAACNSLVLVDKRGTDDARRVEKIRSIRAKATLLLLALKLTIESKKIKIHSTLDHF